MRELLKRLIRLLPIAITKNQRYDRLTRKVIEQVVGTHSVAIDVGCHKGEILDLILQQAPGQHHYAFEPIPELYNTLVEKYGSTCSISNIALSNQKGSTTFNYVVTNPAYSGLRKRKYDREEKDTKIMVETDLLDQIVPASIPIDFIKIDVEGAEQWVLEGAIQTITRCKPIIVFEHGLGASEFYNSSPEGIFALMQKAGLLVNTLDGFLAKSKAFTLSEFKQQFDQRLNYYFIAYP